MTGAQHARKVAREEAVHARERLGRLARRVKREAERAAQVVAMLDDGTAAGDIGCPCAEDLCSEAATCALTMARLDSAIAVAFEIEENP